MRIGDIPASLNGDRIDRHWYEEYSKELPDWELEQIARRWRTIRKLAMNGRLKERPRNVRLGSKFVGSDW